MQANAENRPHPTLVRASNGSETHLRTKQTCNPAAIAGDNAGWTSEKPLVENCRTHFLYQLLRAGIRMN